ncbi:endo-1,4-beta-xylanase [Demequina sp. SO4-18]|uniref:endo-1,4-beta-xylanase n=1 Tax=Demequina sp. SO4-18 TaxID=3401026 RepID=UPI003B5BAC8E
MRTTLRPTAAVAFAAMAAILLSFALVPATSGPARAAASGEVSIDFEDGTTGTWVANGDASLEVVDDGSGENMVLSVSGRTATYEGVTSPTGAYDEGVEYTFSMDVKLSAASALRLIANETGADNEYVWMGNITAAADEWVTVTGTHVFGAGAPSAKVYLEVAELTDYEVDNIAVTAPATEPEPCLPVTDIDFEDGTTGSWVANGDAALEVVDDGSGSNMVLAVAGRTASYEGASSATGEYDEGVAYTFSVDVRVSADSALRLIANETGADNEYVWLGNTNGVAGEWVTLTGTHTFGAGASNAKVYVEVAELGDYDVDNILVTAPCGEDEGIVIEPGFVPGGAVDPSASPANVAQAPEGGEENYAALTFDDGPNPAVTNELLDFLQDNGVKAAFCVIGQNISTQAQIATLNRIVDEGHVLCNHTTGYAAVDQWSDQAIADDLMANLEIIRNAVGDPNLTVPFFRAPNGTWGNSGAVAAELGMQPLAVVNTIEDWNDSLTQEQITANLESVIVPANSGELILVHDGGGDRTKTLNAVKEVVADRLANGWAFTLPAGTPEAAGTVAFSTDFENGSLDGWELRDSGWTEEQEGGPLPGTPSVELTEEEAASPTHSAKVANRNSQGDGLRIEVTDLLAAGTQYEVTASIKFAPGETPGNVWMSLQNGPSTFNTLSQFGSVFSNSEWTEVTGSFTMPSVAEGNQAWLYFETAWDGGAKGNTSTFYVDDISAVVPAPPVIQDLTPMKDTVPFPLGVAIDSRETVGAPSDLLLQHFNQISAENFMKPEAWYNAAGEWDPNEIEIDSLMDFAVENDLGVYGHVLVWHSQTPAWFFQDEAGEPLTDSEADRQILLDRMKTHIDNVVAYLAQWGDYGAGNPIVAFDVVNEVIDDSAAYDDGMRRSQWYRILGEEFVDAAFHYAKAAFGNHGSDAAVELFINDYNTEQSGKRGRYLALIDRMLDRGAPLDGIGHQFHVNLALPVGALEDAIVDSMGRGLSQAVTELDVTTGVPTSEAKFIDQGYYYRDAFDIFREYQDELDFVTIWGLVDTRSWRNDNGGPLVFDGAYQAKPAYYGIVEGAGTGEPPLPPRTRTANAFEGSVELNDDATTSPVWERLPLLPIESKGDFQFRWAQDHLTVFVTVEDGTVDAADGLEFTVNGTDYAVDRSGDGDADAVVTATAGGYDAVVHLPLAAAAESDDLSFDVRIVDGDQTVGWNTAGATGSVTLVEPLSYVEIPQTAVMPTIDGEAEAAWSAAPMVTTDKFVDGNTAAPGEFYTLWNDNTLYVYAEIPDPSVDVTGSDPWTQDSVEIYVDGGNFKNGSYRYDDMQVRINADNVVSFGTGDEGFQANRVESATSRFDGGWTVEAAISLLEYGGEGSFHGVDFQINGATDGARHTIRNWADPTGAGYQSTARWGVAQLVDGSMPFSDVDDSLEHYEAIEWMWENGLTTGFEDGTFRPFAPLSRDAIAAFLYRLEDPEYTAPTEPMFSDVTPDSSEFYTEISWMGDTGLSTGWEDGTFRPFDSTTRDAMAAFLYRYVDPEGYEAPAQPMFSDVTPGSTEFYTEISWMGDTGLSTGWDDGTYRPLEPLTRDAFAAFLYRLMGDDA